MKVLQVRYGSPDAPQKFCQSLVETGFAVLTDHPIPEKLIFDTYKDWEQFFNSEAKHDYRFDPKIQSGYFPFRTENAKDVKQKDLKEFFHLFSWHQLPKGMSDNTWDMFHKMTALAVELLTWIQNDTPEEIKKNFSMPLQDMTQNSRETLLRILHYPPLTGVEEDGAIRAAAHEDINLITLLASATAPGLEVKDTRGNWHMVECNPGSIAINAGDMLQLATRGYYKSTTHRVVNPHGEAAKKPRYSMPLFLHPRSEVVLSLEHTAGTYLKQRLEEIGLIAKANKSSY